MQPPAAQTPMPAPYPTSSSSSSKQQRKSGLHKGKQPAAVIPPTIIDPASAPPPTDQTEPHTVSAFVYYPQQLQQLHHHHPHSVGSDSKPQPAASTVPATVPDIPDDEPAADEPSSSQQEGDDLDLLSAIPLIQQQQDADGNMEGANMQQVTLMPGQLPIAFPPVPPGAVPVAYFAGPSGTVIAVPQAKPKRKQVKNACTNCQKACKKCDEARPCQRCVKFGYQSDCIDSQRKERKKGVKRGPYKKRELKNVSDNEISWVPLASLLAAAAGSSTEGGAEQAEGSSSGQNTDPNAVLDNPAALQALANGAIFYSIGQGGSNQAGLQGVKLADGTVALPHYFFTPSIQPIDASPEAASPQPESEDEGPTHHESPQQIRRSLHDHSELHQQRPAPQPTAYPVQYYSQVGQMPYGQTLPSANSYVLQPNQQTIQTMYMDSMASMNDREEPIHRHPPTVPSSPEAYQAPSSSKGKRKPRPNGGRKGSQSSQVSV